MRNFLIPALMLIAAGCSTASPTATLSSETYRSTVPQAVPYDPELCKGGMPVADVTEDGYLVEGCIVEANLDDGMFAVQEGINNYSLIDDSKGNKINFSLIVESKEPDVNGIIHYIIIDENGSSESIDDLTQGSWNLHEINEAYSCAVVYVINEETGKPDVIVIVYGTDSLEINPDVDTATLFPEGFPVQ